MNFSHHGPLLEIILKNHPILTFKALFGLFPISQCSPPHPLTPTAPSLRKKRLSPFLWEGKKKKKRCP